MAKQNRSLVVARNTKIMREGLYIEGKHIPFKKLTARVVHDKALARDIDKKYGLKGSGDVWVEQDEKLENQVNYHEGGIHHYFFGRSSKFAEGWDRVFGKNNPKFVVIGDCPYAHKLAEKISGEYIQSEQYSEELIFKLKPDWIITFATKVIISDTILEKFKCINVHPAPLPEYAGLHCAYWALRNGEKEYGVTIHHTVSKIDAGNIIMQERFNIQTDNESILFAQACYRGYYMALAVVDYIIAGKELPSIQQDFSKRKLYTEKKYIISGCSYDSDGCTTLEREHATIP